MGIFDRLRRVSFAFWSDPNSTIEEVSILLTFVAGSTIFGEILEQTGSHFGASKCKYIVSVLFIYIIAYFIIGPTKFLLNIRVLNFIRLLVVHTCLIILGFITVVTFNLWGFIDEKELFFITIITTILILLNTLREKNKSWNELSNPQKISIILSMISSTLISYYAAMFIILTDLNT